MEAKELMVGDLCCEWNNDHTEKHVVKVTQIQKEGVRDRYNVFHENDWIEPIPLTAEMLVKNGFKGIGLYVYTDLDTKITWTGITKMLTLKTIDIETVSAFKVECKCEYVHELQHALRLVGLNEVADNLKV